MGVSDGLGADHNMFKPQIEKYSDKGYFVIVMDLRAHGLSEKVKKLTLNDWAEDIMTLINYLKIDVYCIIGISMGGVIAQYFVSKYPNKINKLILSDTFGELKTLKERLISFTQVTVLGFIRKKTFAKILARTYNKLGAKKASDYFYNITLNLNFKQLVLARKAINKIDVLDDLKGFEKPSLVLVGESAGKYFVKINKKVANSLNNSKFEVIKDSMDPSNLVKTEEFDRKVLNFLKRN
ncbi:MAG: alpha/beta hydrolase [Firmicutes bacterium]|nr:alpha/beta hydrolase [Bacillota bacterium]